MEADIKAGNIKWTSWQDSLEPTLGGIISCSKEGRRICFCLCDITSKWYQEGSSQSRLEHKFEVEKISKWNSEKYEWIEKEGEGNWESEIDFDSGLMLGLGLDWFGYFIRNTDLDMDNLRLLYIFSILLFG
jgi:hypothetical protein